MYYTHGAKQWEGVVMTIIDQKEISELQMERHNEVEVVDVTYKNRNWKEGI